VVLISIPDDVFHIMDGVWGYWEGSGSVQSPGLDVECFLGCPTAGGIFFEMFVTYTEMAVVPWINITSADITQDSIGVNLGPAGFTGLLSLAVQYGAGGANQFSVLVNASRSAGNHTESFNPTAIPRNEYTVIQAEWVGQSASVVALASCHFKALGDYTNSFYNTPSEAACAGSPVTRTYVNGMPPNPCINVDPNCTSHNWSFKADFVEQADLNGSGYSSSLASYVGLEWVCAAHYRTEAQPCPYCQIDLSLAVSQYNTDLGCTDSVFVYTLGAGVVADHGGGLTTTQLDHYTSTGACTRNIGTPVTLKAFKLY
jgi:hypothetical protein